MLHILLKLADFVETQEDSDEEFEDCMDAIDNDEVIDLDNFKEECYNCLTKQFDVILQRTRTLTPGTCQKMTFGDARELICNNLINALL